MRTENAASRTAGATVADDAYPAGPVVGCHPCKGGDTHDEQGPGRGGARVLTEQVDQRGDGQDRAAAAERAETEPDEQTDGQSQR